MARVEDVVEDVAVVVADAEEVADSVARLVASQYRWVLFIWLIFSILLFVVSQGNNVFIFSLSLRNFICERLYYLLSLDLSIYVF